MSKSSTFHSAHLIEGVKIRNIKHFNIVISFIATLWMVYFVSFILPLKTFGIVPRTSHGLIGIVASPLLHANLGHILANTVSLLTFGFFSVLLEGRRIASVIVGVALIGGGLTWAFARSANHIGASGVIFGLFGYLLFIGFFQKKLKFILASVVCLSLFGSMIFGILPGYPSVSWESHLFGFLSGAVMAKYRGR